MNTSLTGNNLYMKRFLHKVHYFISRIKPKVILRTMVHPSLFRVLLRNLFRTTCKLSSDQDHLKGAMDWLCRSQDVTGTGGSAASFGFESGWALPYPETTGYIISTFLKYATYTGDPLYLERAGRMGDWEIEIQLPSGAVRGGSGVNEYPIVFNTGMVILGWADLYKATGEERYLNAAVRASDWLCSIIDNDGKWSRYTYNGIPHAYHSRVAWSLFVMAELTADNRYRMAALANTKWVLSLAGNNGWIEMMGFSSEEVPLTHTIVYTLRGLLECSHYLDGDIKTQVDGLVFRSAEKILMRYEKRKKHPNALPGYLPGRFNSGWQPAANFSCLTGSAQIAIVWLKLYRSTGDARLLNASLKILDQLKEQQDLESSNPGIRGAIAGSSPIWGDYMPWSYPNWATKFFADALMLQEDVMRQLEEH
jgi:hypothetical protein